MVKILCIIFFVGLLVVFLNTNMRRILQRYLSRGCTGFAWRRRFPKATNPEIREFLDIFIEAFGFKTAWRLKFSPDDRVMDIYRTLYPPKLTLSDGCELESLERDLQKRYGFEVAALWREDITLGDLFAAAMRNGLTD